MTKVAVEQFFNGASVPYSSYSSSSITLGPLIQQQTSTVPYWAGPQQIAVARPFEATTSIPIVFPHVMNFSSTIDWVFGIDNSTAAATRRVVWYTYNRTTNLYTWMGFVTLTYPTATTHTVRGFRMTRDLYTTGTVSVSTTTVTGSGTAWQTNNICVGNRIGFGTTDPTQVTTWYTISAIGSDTSITLSSSAGTIAAGTSFVIEDLRAVSVNTNATTTNGGVFVAKGLNVNLFTTTGTTIPAATTTDNIQAVYWLADASTVTNISACGAALLPTNTTTDHDLYVLDLTSPAKVYRYNIRASLAGLAAGKSTSAFTYVTGQATITGTLTQTNNGKIATLGHGPGNGVQCLYFATGSRVYRAVLSNITSGSTTFISDAMVEIPPGSINTFAATGSMSFIEYDSVIDRLLVLCVGRSYITQYNTTSAQFNNIWLLDDKQSDESSADPGTTPHPSVQAALFTVGIGTNGVYHCLRAGTTAFTSMMYAVPAQADWAYASTTNNYLITPAISTPSASKLYRLYTFTPPMLGSNTLGIPTEPYQAYYRTSGITDNSGTWIAVPANGDLSGVSVSTQIQFMFEFRIFGYNALPARIYSMTLLYEQASSILSQFEWNLNDSSLSNGTVGFDQIATFGGTVPNITIQYYNSSTNTIVMSQSSTGNANGQFQYYLSGTWTNGLGTDTIGTRRRFVPSAGIPSNTNLYVNIVLS